MGGCSPRGFGRTVTPTSSVSTDSALGPQHLMRWQRRLPQAMVVAIPDAGHWPHEESPDQVIDAVRTFLE